MTLKTFLGWFLLLIGILIIFSILYSSYNIFTAKTEVPEIFNIEEQIEKKEQIKEDGSLKEVSLQQQKKMMEEIVGEQIKEIFPTAFLSTLFNLIAWSIFAGISIFAGFQLSSLGIKLIKP